MEVIYTATVYFFYRKMQLFPQDSMKQEIRSILLQFLSFFVGWTIETLYETVQLIENKCTFALACFNIFVVIFAFVQPIFYMLYSHHKTFSKLPVEQQRIFSSKLSSGNHRDNRLEGSVSGILLLE